MTRLTFNLLFAALLAVVSLRCAAEDIDLYNANPTATTAPNVLIVMDNTSNWNLVFENEMAAIQTAIATLDDAGSVNIGLMEQTSGGADGGYVRFAIRPMTAANKSALINLIGEIVARGKNSSIEKAGNPSYAQVMNEAWLYFKGGTPRTGLNDPKRDCGAGNTANNPIAAALGGGYAYTSCATSGAAYVSPFDAGNSCQKNFIVYVSNGAIANNDNGPGGTLLAAARGVTLASIARLPPVATGNYQETGPNYADEWAQWLYATDLSTGIEEKQSVATYTIDVNPVRTGQGPDHTQMMKNMAVYGGGQYCATGTSLSSITSCFVDFFTQILAINSVFVSASLPVSVNTQGTYLNQVYMGMFRPQATGNPRWAGNMKQYQFRYDGTTGNLELADSTGNAALNAAAGFIKPTAVSFWTTANPNATATPSGFWINSPASWGTVTATSMLDAPDGDIVEKGGAGEVLRYTYLTSQAGRKVYTCPGVTGCSGASAATPIDLTATGNALNKTNVAGTAAQIATFGAATAAEVQSIVDWARGADNGPEGTGPGGTVTVRPSVHADVLHTKPQLVNYGASVAGCSTGIVAYYASNDGMFRAVCAGQATGGNTDGGVELWSFMAPEFFPGLKRLRDGTPVLDLPSASSGLPGALPASTGAKPKGYFFDGNVGNYEVRNASQVVTREYIYVSARRGGSLIYALDVTVPSAPKILWKKTSADLPQLAMTFSTPKIVRVKNASHPAVLVFGAGYWGGYDGAGNPVGDDSAAAPSTCPAGTACGRAIYVLDALDGSLVKTFTASANGGGSIAHSMAADVSTHDTDGDGFADRGYAVDTGGNVWRMDIDNASASNWNLFKLATAASDSGNPRKFLYPPSVVQTRSFAAVMMGSGDREKPLKTGNRDRFYMFKDPVTCKDASSNVAPCSAALVPISGDNNLADARNLSAADLSSALASGTNRGWYFPLDADEKVVNAPLTLAGIAYFSTNTPPSSQLVQVSTCTGNLGVAKAYGLNFTTGTAGRDLDNNGVYDPADVAVTLTGGGLPPSPVGGLVTVTDSATGAPAIVPFCIGCGGGSPIDDRGPGGTPCTGASCGTPCPTGLVRSGIGASKVCVLIKRNRSKTYWNNKYDQ